MTPHQPNRRVAVTGIGMVTAQGLSLDETWDGIMRAGDCLSPWNLPGPAANLPVARCPHLPVPHDLPAYFWNSLAQTGRLAAIALDQALADAHLSHQNPSRGEPLPLFLGTTACGMDRVEKFAAQYMANPDQADPRLLSRLEPYALGELLVRRHELPQSATMFLSTCVASAMALGAACDAILAGRAEIAIAGGSDALCQVIVSGFNSLKLVAPDGCRPFDETRTGMTPGEGAALLVLESPEHAAARGAKIRAFISGYSATCDAWHMTGPKTDGSPAARAMREAMDRAGIGPQDISYVNAHGTATRDNDAMECRAFTTVFAGNHRPPVSSTKRWTGHTFGAAGAIEAALSIRALETGLLPPNAPVHQVDPLLVLPLVQVGTPAPLRHVLHCNSAFGGNNTALVLSHCSEAAS